MRKEVNMENCENKKIYCPRCSRKLGMWDGKTKTSVIVNCHKCKKQIIYHPLTAHREIKNITPRNTASGVTFR